MDAALPADLAALSAAVRAYTERPVGAAPEAGSQDVLEAQLECKRALINRLELDFARDAATLEAVWDDDGSMDSGAFGWLRESCRMTSHAVLTALRVGRLGPRLAASRAALVAGRIGFAHMGLLAATADAVDASATATAPFDEARLLRQAETLSVQRFRTECRHYRHRVDREAFLHEQTQDREFRTLSLRSLGEGAVELTGFLDPEGGALLRTALEPLARRAPDDDRSAAQRHADALVELCTRALDRGTIPQRAGQRPHLQVTCTLDTLFGRLDAPAGEVEFGGLVAGVSVQRYACDATVTRVLLDAQSAVVDMGRQARVVPGATRRALTLRDRGCRWPGCSRSASWTAAHHIVHWAHGGRTDLANLVLLCARHHWSVHEGGWRLRRAADGSIAVEPRSTAHAAHALRTARASVLRE